MEEQWKAYDDVYEVSDQGRVRRYVDGKTRKAGRLLKIGIDNQGYASVKMRNSSKAVHRLVWRVFCGDVPFGYYIVQKNGDRGDARLENLILKNESRRRDLAIGEEEISEILEERRGDASYGELVRWHGISAPTLRKIIHSREESL